MRLFLIALVCACGGRPGGDRAMATGEPPPRPVLVEWKVEQGDGNQVNVVLVVDGRSVALGALEAATTYEAGTPATCALRAASPRRTEIICGDSSGYAADLVDTELVITFVAENQRDEVKRIAVDGDALAVKMLALPLDEPAR